MLSLSEEDKKILAKMQDEVSTDILQKNWDRFMEYTPIHSGSIEEVKAINFLKEKLKEYGLEAKILQYDAYISDPKKAKLEILKPINLEVQCTPYRQVGTTGPEGIEGEVIYIPSEDIGIRECKNKIILADQKMPDDWMGLQNGKLLQLEKMGVKGLIIIEQDDYMPTVVHQRADFSVSGNPTSDNVHLIQKIPAMVHVSHKDGQFLKKIVKEGNMYVKIISIVDTGWKTLPLLVADLRGSKDPNRFLIIAGHVDTPPFSPGIADNASGDVAILEIARLLSKYRKNLRRSVRLIYWTGHEIGRYAGSTWYNDAFWHDLRYNCIGVFNIDSPGAEGATIIGVSATSELREAAIDSIKTVTGLQEVSIRGSGIGTRAGDCSFWGTGITHTDCLSTRPKEMYDPYCNFSGGGWWWHTPYATKDFGDVNILATDVKVQLNYIYKLTNNPILPMNYIPYADALLSILNDYQKKANKIKAYFNLYPVIERAKEFKELVEKLEEIVKLAVMKKSSEQVMAELDHCLLWIGRYLHPVAHSNAEITEQVTMEYFGAVPFPRIYEILKLADMTLHQPPDFKFLTTKLIRQRNLVEDAFYQANELIKKTISSVENSIK